MAKVKTLVQARMEEQLKHLPPDSKRHRVLSVARRFKDSWIELGEALCAVRSEELYRQWGYQSLEAYCWQELHVRRDTVEKLLRSFALVKDRQREPPNERSARELPPLDVVDLLARARERTQIPESDLTKIQEDVFEAENVPNRSQVMRRLRELDPDAFRSASKPEPTASAGSLELRKALLLAERLHGMLVDDTDTPGPVQEAAGEVVGHLRQRLGQPEALSA